MREIKFRAYIKNLKWIVPVSRINFDCETVEVDLTDGNGDFAEYDFNEIILMQYTGLKDKNGVEIYEGDILDENGRLFVVVWDARWAKFKLQHEQGHYQYPEWNRGIQMERVGNIHDNELMEVQTGE